MILWRADQVSYEGGIKPQKLVLVGILVESGWILWIIVGLCWLCPRLTSHWILGQAIGFLVLRNQVFHS